MLEVVSEKEASRDSPTLKVRDSHLRRLARRHDDLRLIKRYFTG